MLDNEATDADATETFDDGGNSLFNFALMGAPPMLRSALATIAAFASVSELNATYQMFVLPSTYGGIIGRVVSVVKDAIISIGLTPSVGRSITATCTKLSILFAATCWCACCC